MENSVQPFFTRVIESRWTSFLFQAVSTLLRTLPLVDRRLFLFPLFLPGRVAFGGDEVADVELRRRVGDVEFAADAGAGLDADETLDQHVARRFVRVLDLGAQVLPNQKNEHV